MKTINKRINNNPKMKKIVALYTVLVLIPSYQLHGQLDIGLAVNYSQNDTVYRDELILLQVTLANAEADWQQAWNLESKAYLDELQRLRKNNEITEEYLEKEKQRISKQFRSP